MERGWRRRFQEQRPFTWRRRISLILSGHTRLPRPCLSSCCCTQMPMRIPYKQDSKCVAPFLADAHVDRAIANTTEFTREFQELITRYAWGMIWSRPELDRRTRRLLALSITASLGRWEELPSTCVRGWPVISNYAI